MRTVILFLALFMVAAAPAFKECEPPLSGAVSNGGRAIKYASSVYKIGGEYHYVYKIKFTGTKRSIVHWTVVDGLAGEHGWPCLIDMSPGQELTLTHVSKLPPAQGKGRAVIFSHEQKNWIQRMRGRGTILSGDMDIHTLAVGAATYTWGPKAK